MKLIKPDIKPNNINFSSGPTAKRPHWDISNLSNASVGRSHRSKICKDKLKFVIDKSKKILNLPKDYLLGIMPASDTGALEASLWGLLGQRGVDIFAWENFGNDWLIDLVEELKIKDLNIYKTDYGKIPNLNQANFSRDVIFTWNGTTSGVKVPDSKWISDHREGLTICDATSAIFAMPIDFNKCDVLTWSWQKALGGEAAHGMLAISPNAVKRLETYRPSWPIPKTFRLAKNKKLISGIFEGSTINTPSMICVEDAIDTLNWVETIGGLDELIKRSNKSFNYISMWIKNSKNFEFIDSNEKTRSNTSITFKIKENWFIKKDLDEQKSIIKKICSLLESEKIAYDVSGYAKAPPSFRVWGGGTIEPNDIKKLLPWFDWAYEKIKIEYV